MESKFHHPQQYAVPVVVEQFLSSFCLLALLVLFSTSKTNQGQSKAFHGQSTTFHGQWATFHGQSATFHGQWATFHGQWATFHGQSATFHGHSPTSHGHFMDHNSWTTRGFDGHQNQSNAIILQTNRPAVFLEVGFANLFRFQWGAMRWRQKLELVTPCWWIKSRPITVIIVFVQLNFLGPGSQ